MSHPPLPQDPLSYLAKPQGSDPLSYLANVNTTTQEQPKKEEPKKNILEKIVDYEKRQATIAENAFWNASAGIANTLDVATKKLEEKTGGLVRRGGLFGKAEERLRKEVKPVEEQKDAGILQKTDEFLSGMAGALPAAMGAARVINPILAPVVGATVTPGVAKLLTRTSVPEAVKAGITQAISSIPSNFAGNYIIDRQGTLTPMGIALTAFGSLIEGGIGYSSYMKAASKIGKAITEAKTPEDLANLKDAYEQTTQPYFKTIESRKAASQLPEVNPLQREPASMMAPPGPEQVVGPVNTQLPTWQEAGLRNVDKQIQAEFDARLAALNNKEPLPNQSEADARIAAAAAKDAINKLTKVDPSKVEIVDANFDVVSTVEKAPQTNTGVVTPNQFEVRQYGTTEPRQSSGRGIGILIDNVYFTQGELQSILDAHNTIATKRIEGATPRLRWVNTLSPDIEQHIQELYKMAVKLGQGPERVPSTTWEIPPTKKTAYVTEEGPAFRKINRAEQNPIDGVVRTTTNPTNWASTNKPYGTVAGVAEGEAPVLSRERRSVPLISSTEIVPPSLVPESGDAVFKDAVSRANIDYGPARVETDPISFRQKFVDRIIPIKDISPKAYDILSNLGAARREAEVAINQQMALPEVIDGQWTGKSIPIQARPLNTIIKEAGKDIVAVEAYMKALTTVKNPKLDTGMSVKDATAILETAPENVKAWTAEIKKVTDFMVDYQVTLGRISSETGARMKNSPYTALGRVFNAFTPSNFRARRVGSSRASRAVMGQLVDQMYRVIEQGKRNYAYSKLADMVDADPTKYMGIMEDAKPVAMEEFNADVQKLVDEGLTFAEAQQQVQQAIQGTLDHSDGSVIIFRNGLGAKYKLNPTMRMAVESMNPIELGVLGNVGKALSTPLRESVAAATDLSLTGPMSDAVFAAASDPAFNIILSPMQGLWHAVMKTDKYKEAIRAGVGFGGRFRSDIIEPKYPAVKSTGLRTAGKVLASPITTYTSSIRAINDIIRPLNDASRVGMYLARIRAGDDAITAAAKANNSIGNWNRVGAQLRGWSMATEFFNTGIQGSEAVGRLLSNARKDPKVAANLLGLGTGTITIPTIYFWAAAQKDEEINQLRKATNYDYWYGRKPDGSIWKARKLGWTLASIFGAPVEAALDALYDSDPDIAKRLAETVINSVGFNPIPVAIQTGLGLGFNTRNPLRAMAGADKIPIVPSSQQGVAPEAQGGLNTSVIAGAASKFGVSPYKTDFLLNQVFGADGAELLRLVTGGNSGAERKDMVIGRYQVLPGAPTLASNMFYKDMDKAREVDATLREFELKGDEEGYIKYAKKNEQYVGLYDSMQSTIQELSKMNQYARYISRDTEMSPEAKKNVQKEISDNMNKIFMDYYKAKTGK